MNWLFRSLNSSIGKKVIMAITGISLILFLLFHLANNLTLFAGPTTFNTVVKSLDSIKPFVRVIEVILALIFIFHIFNGVRLWYENKKARPTPYAVNGSSKNSSLLSRTMIQTGSIIFIFLVIHLSTFWNAFNFSDLHHTHTYYEFTAEMFTNIYYSIFYIIAMIILGFHLNHGFQSAFQTFGWNNKKYFPLVTTLGLLYSILMAVAFASIPIYFLLIGGN